MHELDRQLGKLESRAMPLPTVRRIVAKTLAEEAAAEATRNVSKSLHLLPICYLRSSTLTASDRN